MSLKDPLSILRPEKVNRFDLPFQILFHLPRGYLRRVSPVCNLVQHRDCLSERLFKWTLAFLSGCSEQLETRLALRCGRKTRCASRLTRWGTERSEWSRDNCIRLCADHWYPVTGLKLVGSFIEPQPFHNRNRWILVGIWICYLSRYPGICNTSNDMVKLPLASLELLAGVQKWRRSRILNQARWTASWRGCLKMCTAILMFKWNTPYPTNRPTNYLCPIRPLTVVVLTIMQHKSPMRCSYYLNSRRENGETEIQFYVLFSAFILSLVPHHSRQS